MDPWEARLSLRFSSPRQGVTMLTHRESYGPLTLQKILHPEGPEIAHAFVLHPPSGIAGGDQLQLSVGIASGAHALLTTPGATRWYKANGRDTFQKLHLEVADHGCLEWLPSENLFFDESQAQMYSCVSLSRDARFIGWEVMQFGQRQSLKSVDHHWRASGVRAEQSISIGGTLDWQESARYTDQTVLDRPTIQGTAGYPVVGTLWAYGPDTLPESAREDWVQKLTFSENLRVGCTQLPSGLIVCRVLAQETDVAREAMIQAWAWLRPRVIGRQAEPLRIWAT
jgi:urease accessory protein